MATGGLYLYNDCEQKLDKVLVQRFRELLFENGSLVPTMTDLQPGAAELKVEVLTQVGDAEILADGAFDIPTVEIASDQDVYRVLMVASGMSWTFQQERAAQFSGVDVSTRKMMAARRAIAERMNRISSVGDSRSGFTGYYNNANVPVVASSFNPYTASGTDLVSFFIDLIQQIVTGSNNVEYPTDIIVSTELDFLLIESTLPNTGISAKETIMQRFNTNPLRSGVTITGVQESRASYLEQYGVQPVGTGKDRIVVYPNDPQIIERHIESSIAQLFPPEYQEVRNTRRVIPMYGCTSPTIIGYPNAMRYIDLVKKP